MNRRTFMAGLVGVPIACVLGKVAPGTYLVGEHSPEVFVTYTTRVKAGLPPQWQAALSAVSRDDDL